MTTDGPQWSAGHQPVTDFHTGLLAKVAKVRVLNGLWLCHDLDTLEEQGAVSIKVPTKRGDIVTVRLLDTDVAKENLFCSGPVRVTSCSWSGVYDRLVALINGRLPKPVYKEGIRGRVELLQKRFPQGMEFESVVDFNDDLLSFLLPRIGVTPPRWVRLSTLVADQEWMETFLRAATLLGNPSERFWWWCRETSTRREPKAAEMVNLCPCTLAGCLIPRAETLAVSMRMRGPVIRGIGQEEYEAAISVALPGDAITITSNQGLPPVWRSFAPSDFRPSALLLWLIGGLFDPETIIER